MTVRLLLACLPALLAAEAASAQSSTGNARLDEFAAPMASSSSVSVDQVPGSGEARAMSAPRSDPADIRQPVVQIGPVGERRAPQQVGRDQQRNAGESPSLATRREGRPGAVVTLGGSDRCDPQREDAERLALCRRILERRAADFAAVRPAQVSAESALLALEQNGTSLADSAKMDRRFRTSQQAMDANDAVNQELAAITLAAANQSSLNDATPSSDEPTLNQSLVDLVVQFQGGKP